MYPFRFSLLTLNLWNTEHWEERLPAIRKFLETYDPDICCFQEVRESTLLDIDTILTGHRRIDDSLPGWVCEGTIYYRKSLFDEVAHGAVDLEMPEVDRRLFWIRLSMPETGKTLFVSTVHLTHQGNEDECATGYSYRHREAVLAREGLDELGFVEEAMIVCGDFNDPVHPSRLLMEHGYIDIYHILGILQDPTFPCAAMTDEIYFNETIDKILCKGPVRPILASVSQFYYDQKGISDHWPVIAVFSMKM